MTTHNSIELADVENWFMFAIRNFLVLEWRCNNNPINCDDKIRIAMAQFAAPRQGTNNLVCLCERIASTVLMLLLRHRMLQPQAAGRRPQAAIACLACRAPGTDRPPWSAVWSSVTQRDGGGQRSPPDSTRSCGSRSGGARRERRRATGRKVSPNHWNQGPKLCVKFGGLFINIGSWLLITIQIRSVNINS